MPARVPDDERLRLTIEICGRIAAGESLNGIFRKRPAGYPDRQTWWVWRAKNKELGDLFIHALQERGLCYAEEIVELADTKPKTLKDGRVDSGWVMWNRERIETRKWNAARLQQKLYGDRTVVAGDADSPLHVEISDPKAALLRGLAPRAAGSGTLEQSAGADR